MSPQEGLKDTTLYIVMSDKYDQQIKQIHDHDEAEHELQQDFINGIFNVVEKDAIFTSGEPVHPTVAPTPAEPVVVLPVSYMKFRLTLDDDPVTDETIKKQFSPARLRARAMVYVNKIVEQYALEGHSWSAAVEVMNSLGNYVKPHFHLHFTTHAKRDTIVKCIKRLYKATTDELMKGNSVFSLKAETFIDPDRFFRYPLKQIADLAHRHNLTPSHFFNKAAELMRMKAHEQWKLGCEINATKAARHEPTLDRYARMFEFLDKQNPATLTEVIKQISLFYIKENSPMNMTTIKGYAIQYCLKTGLMDMDIFVANIERSIYTS